MASSGDARGLLCFLTCLLSSVLQFTCILVCLLLLLLLLLLLFRRWRKGPVVGYLPPSRDAPTLKQLSRPVSYTPVSFAAAAAAAAATAVPQVAQGTCHGLPATFP
jgi:hypothetical protein